MQPNGRERAGGGTVRVRARDARSNLNQPAPAALRPPKVGPIAIEPDMRDHHILDMPSGHPTVGQKHDEAPAIRRRKPLQERSQQKVALILEATMRLLDRGDLESLTTNAIAEKAGVSIGTLYQYFDGKQSVVDMLIDREIGGLSERVFSIVQQSPGQSVGDRIRMIVAAVADTYGGRRRVHRLLLAHALSQGTATRLRPLFASLTHELTSPHRADAAKNTRRFAPGEAFVLTHAVAGVLRGLVTTVDLPVPREEIENALVRLVEGFLDAK
jgi:AcrR family transcriptional regulator